MKEKENKKLNELEIGAFLEGVRFNIKETLEKQPGNELSIDNIRDIIETSLSLFEVN